MDCEIRIPFRRIRDQFSINPSVIFRFMRKMPAPLTQGILGRSTQNFMCRLFRGTSLGRQGEANTVGGRGGPQPYGFRYGLLFA